MPHPTAKSVRRKPCPPPAPLLYTREIADEICARIASGESALSVCRDPRMPAYPTVHGWSVQDRDGFRARLEEARKCAAQRFADELDDLAAVKPADKLEAEWLRTRISTKQWIVSKLLSHTYGDKIRAEQSGKIVVEIRRFGDDDGTTHE